MSKAADSNRELYAFYKAHGICVSCGRSEAAPGRVRCEECLAKNAETAQERRDRQTAQQKAEQSAKGRRIRAQWRVEGKCIWCGKPLDAHSKCFCTECRIKNQRNNDRKKSGIDRSERPAYGLCYRCGRPIESGSLCEKCKQISINNLPDKMNDELYQINKGQNNLIFGNSV